MPRRGHLWLRWLAWAGVATSLCATAGRATEISDPDAFLKQTAALQLTDHARFERQLAQLNQESARLTKPGQIWRLRLLNAWEAMYEGDYVKSEPLFRDIIGHAGDPELESYAAGLLLSQLSMQRQYEPAFALANELVARLPQFTEPHARFSLLLNLSQVMGWAGQTDLAIRYARMMRETLPDDESQCEARTMEVQALSGGRRLTLDSPELQQALDACQAAGQPVSSQALWLLQAKLYIEAGQGASAVALLERIEPDVRRAHYADHLLAIQVQLAQAYALLGNDEAAETAARAALALRPSGEKNFQLGSLYEVLYRIEKKQGHADVALKYYEQYVAQDRSYLDDISARTLAYETVQQHVLAQKLETEQLSRQNASLRLQQKLAAKTAEANRLYIVLLAMALGFGVFGMIRLKRSQLRYRRLSRLDGLTELLNRQHFMIDAEVVLQRLRKRGGAACLAYLDLDHFKRINDTHGHAAGDAVLRDVVAACRQQLRSVDLFGRLGGEEFGILLVDASREQALAIANRIRLSVAADPVAFGDGRIAVSISIGLAFTDSSGHELQHLCMDADAALYLAKDSGRNCVVADGGASSPAPA